MNTTSVQTNPKDYVVDHVILFASNIRGTASTVELYHNPNQSHILANVNTLVRPLQDKGIKVLLGLLGDHTGVGFANLNDAQIESFAQQVADCVNNYGLDGVDFDDEYAEYGRISGALLLAVLSMAN
ncbi:glycosyl hydrolase family 18 protein [Bacteroides thetaiotaomicron]|nr:glycosyl hydrolase family 18 protein [Bacteroides thetaiotaomicron]